MGLLSKIKSKLFSSPKDYSSSLAGQIEEMKKLQSDLLDEIADSIRKTKNLETQLGNSKKRIIELEAKASKLLHENNKDNAKQALKLRNHEESNRNGTYWSYF